ncbi:hypothetical protein PPL_12483 [Heterostelium album PN500]|uniref:Uncharacterized protein n=1 Tax=Heterostelium pallidum (strain ATCC 26659 / Pp 5 / PN500) TaxID=670386 RepID=D3BMR0_HETP5|nr:hypothetical protein PPL_12483 [Heterostelium album PN500]EFA77272.1 hypothetical protein PPL_12483 [Heterostelium album PN500]|eukprot:XP_020429401.1 hypothetical protein PPL_12483 [Heterostelium album PN500]
MAMEITLEIEFAYCYLFIFLYFYLVVDHNIISYFFGQLEKREQIVDNVFLCKL